MDAKSDIGGSVRGSAPSLKAGWLSPSSVNRLSIARKVLDPLVHLRDVELRPVARGHHGRRIPVLQQRMGEQVVEQIEAGQSALVEQAHELEKGADLVPGDPVGCQDPPVGVEERLLAEVRHQPNDRLFLLLRDAGHVDEGLRARAHCEVIVCIAPAA